GPTGQRPAPPSGSRRRFAPPGADAYARRMSCRVTNGQMSTWRSRLGRGVVLWLRSFGLLLTALVGPARARALGSVREKHSNAVTVIDAATKKVVGRIKVGESPSTVAVAPNGRIVYVVNASSHADDVSVIDATTERAVDTIGVGKLPLGVAFRPDGATA